MPTSVAGNASRLAQAGFTLLELLVVLTITAFASAGVIWSLRDSDMIRLEREGLRLAAVLESARSRSQILGTPVFWRPAPQGYAFAGLAAAEADSDRLPRTWQDPDTGAQIWSQAGRPATEGTLVLGPEPLIPPQALVLRSRLRPDKQLWVATDGVRPFKVRPTPP